MSYYGVLFSVELQCADAGQVEWLTARIDAAEEGEDETCFSAACAYEIRDDGRTVWLHTEESGNPDQLAEIVCEFQEKFDVEEPWTLTWVTSTSNQEVGAYDGGAIVCHKGRSFYVTASTWAMNTTSVLERLVSEPLTLAQIRERADENGWVKGIVAVKLDEIVSKDWSLFLDLLSARLVGQRLSDVTITGIGSLDHTDALYFEVEGDVSEILEDD